MDHHIPCLQFISLKKTSTLNSEEFESFRSFQQFIFTLLSPGTDPLNALEQLCIKIASMMPAASVMIDYGKNKSIKKVGTKPSSENNIPCWYLPIKHNGDRLLFTVPTHYSFTNLDHEILFTSVSCAEILLDRMQLSYTPHSSSLDLNILSMAIENGSDSMVVMDRNNRIIKVNDAFIQTFGYEENEVIGTNPFILTSISQEDPLFSEVWETLLKTKHWNKEIWVKGKNGKVFPASVSISAITNQNKKIQNFIAIFNDLSALRESQKQALKLAYYDQLTHLPNRQKLASDLLTKDFSACVVFNIDDFKEINDFFGIEIGDQILKEVGQWFGTMNFSPYRISGDEFAILFSGDITWFDLRSRIMALMTLLEEQIFTINEESISLRMTAGAAIGTEKLLTRADIALNHAKKSKLNLSLYAEHENVEESYRNNMKMSAEIRLALANKRILCHYQPIMNLETQKIDKYEVLARMEQSDGTLTPPADFLPVAKKSKLYPQITLAIIREACQTFASREEEFSINLSESDMRDPRMVKEILSIILKTNTASRIVFEILESEGIENYQEVSVFIHQVKSLGAKIAIDDFGTGYSNFENILKLNVDYIKIDGSLIQGIINNPMHYIVVETIVNFAHKIGAKTIAEYVSSADIYREISALGVDFSQGYYTGRPAPLS